MTSGAVITVVIAAASVLAASVRVHRYSRGHMTAQATLGGRGLIISKTPDGVWWSVRLRRLVCAPTSWWRDDGPAASSGMREPRRPLRPGAARCKRRHRPADGLLTRGRTTRRDRPAAARPAETVSVEVLYFDGCPGHEALIARLPDLMAQAGVDAPIKLTAVQSLQAAEQERFLGSPTLRIDGHDVEPAASQRTDFGLKCRLYACASGLRRTIPDELVLAALTRGADPRHADS